MTTYSGEDGMTGTDEPGLPDEVGPQDYPAEPPPSTYDDHAYNATDVLPAPLPGGRLARRRAEEEARRAEEPTGAKAVVTGGPSAPGRAIIPVALALVSAVALAAAWLHLESDRAAQTGSPAPSASASASASSSPSASPTPSSSPSASPTATATPTAVASPTSTTKPAATVDRSVPVVVLNATSRPGLAAKVAASLRAQGWKVTSVGNWSRGGVDATTIFLNGHVDARATIIKDFPAADGRVELPVAGMPKQRMVIVLGKDYPA